MNADDLKKMYGSTPESFRQCVEQTLAQSPDHAPHRCGAPCGWRWCARCYWRC